MKIIVCGAEKASRFFPEVPTLAIRILGSAVSRFPARIYPPLDATRYSKVLPYTFDDIDFYKKDYIGQERYYLRKKYVLFNKKLARKIISDFDANREKAEDLLVHCYLGRSRSPAVALALNHIFSLNAVIEGSFDSYNEHVFQTMLKAGKKRVKLIKLFLSSIL